jgi:hypothetical protein
MSQLKPGATYIYERDGDVTYAREMGADPNTRVAIGWDYNPINGHRRPIDEPAEDRLKRMKEDQLWADIRREARTNPAVQDALERAIIVYHLSKENNNDDKKGLLWHPV